MHAPPKTPAVTHGCLQIREQRRENKKEVKAANAEKRKTKVPKHVKKKAVSKNKKK